MKKKKPPAGEGGGFFQNSQTIESGTVTGVVGDIIPNSPETTDCRKLCSKRKVRSEIKTALVGAFARSARAGSDSLGEFPSSRQVMLALSGISARKR
jgi:hypothetical protein